MCPLALYSFPTRRSSDLYTSVPWLCATFTDLVFGGWLVDALIRRGWDASMVRQTVLVGGTILGLGIDRKSTRLNSSHVKISYAVFCLKKKKTDDATARYE